MSYGPVEGNILKNGIIWLSGGFVLAAIGIILMAKLLLIYGESRDILHKRFIKDLMESDSPSKKLSKLIADKKPLSARLPDDISVVILSRKKPLKDRQYLLGPKSIPEVIDCGLAVILLKLFPARTFTHKSLPRIKMVFYGLLIVEVVVIIVGLWLVFHVNKY